MKSIVPFRLIEDLSDVLEAFEDQYYQAQMPYLASDLLELGLRPSEIIEAVRRAIAACEYGGLRPKHHFLPVYSARKGMMIRDCKLTQLGYALTMLNASPHHPQIAQWQLRVLQRYLER